MARIIRMPRRMKPVSSKVVELDLLKKKIDVLLPIITDSRATIFECLKLYVTLFTALNGGAIVAILNSSNKQYANMAAPFVLGLCFMIVVFLCVFFWYPLPASYFTKFLFEENENTSKMVNRIKSDSKMANFILFISILTSCFAFAYGAINGMKSIQGVPQTMQIMI